MLELIVKENVLTDNILKVANKGRCFKGRYVAILKEYTFATSWSDKETIRRFRSIDSLYKYLRKYYKEEFEEFKELINERY